MNRTYETESVVYCDPTSLFEELKAEGIPIISIDEFGNAVCSRVLTSNEEGALQAVIEAHDPHAEDEAAALQEELLNEGVTDERLLAALWDAVIEQDDNAARALQQKIADVKERMLANAEIN
ncbi:MAG: hypothetical protein K8R40_11880 [Anaerolineaceae bacterium]|nr:hypothetical protein [Anaerolineaceae bacterium]